MLYRSEDCSRSRLMPRELEGPDMALTLSCLLGSSTVRKLRNICLKPSRLNAGEEDERLVLDCREVCEYNSTLFGY